MARAKKIIIEAANPAYSIRDVEKPNRRLRVCAYARVSTDDEDQKHSYKTQVNYYTKRIMEHEDWEFVDVFTDEGITGTNTLKRTGFNKMIKTCKEGKIDIILTKSVSRFARNTVDSLKTCRDLKRRGVGVIFESDHINTLKDDVEMPLTFAASRAQEESRSISENVKWAFKRKFENGGYMLATSKFIGYDRDENGELVINEAEAEIVRKIFDLFLEGLTYKQIADYLTNAGIRTVMGNEKWHNTVIASMLKNEKYAGNCISQKSYTPDFLTHKRVKNTGQVPKYMMEDHHEAIIPIDKYIKVQERVGLIHENWQKERGSKISTSQYALSNLLVCGKCGSPMRRKTWRLRNGELVLRYGCKNRIDKGKKCNSDYIKETVLQEGVVNALNQYFAKGDVAVETTENIQNKERIKSIDLKLNSIKDEMAQLINPANKKGISNTDRLVEIASEIKRLENDKQRIIKEKKMNKNEINFSISPDTKRVDIYSDELTRRYIEKVIIKDINNISVLFKGGFIVEQCLYI